MKKIFSEIHDDLNVFLFSERIICVERTVLDKLVVINLSALID